MISSHGLFGQKSGTEAIKLCSYSIQLIMEFIMTAHKCLHANIFGSLTFIGRIDTQSTCKSY